MMTTLVVGGRGGIGTATVALLQAQGETVAVLDRADGVDATDPVQVDAFFASLPPLDGLVHLAGTVGVGGIEQHTLQEWHRVMDDSVTSAFVVCKAAIPAMRARRRGAIVLISSVNGRHGGNRLSGPAYATAKAAIIGLTRHLAADLAADGVRVNAIAPGPVGTPMLERLASDELAALMARVPLGRVTPADEIAAAIGFLLSPAAASITGVVLDINGGMWMG